MKTHCLPLAAALMFALSPLAAVAQASAPAASAAASAAAKAKPAPPRQRTPAELRDAATPPGELRPEKPVVPQVSIPFGKTPPASVKAETRTSRRGKPASSSGGVDDAAARCEAEANAQARATCRANRAREARNPAR
jgi:hypothetical protein